MGSRVDLDEAWSREWTLTKHGAESGRLWAPEWTLTKHMKLSRKAPLKSDAHATPVRVMRVTRVTRVIRVMIRVMKGPTTAQRGAHMAVMGVMI